MYEDIECHKFKLLHCYEVLKRSQKWSILREQMSISKKRKSTKKRCATPLEDLEIDYFHEGDNSNDPNDNDGDSPSTPSPSSCRPVGSKKAQASVSEIQVRRSLARQTSRIASAQEARNEVLSQVSQCEQTKVQLALFSQDINSVRGYCKF